MKIRVSAAIVSALALVGFSANGAWAFYNTAACGASGNYMNVSNYSKGSGQEYHISTNAASKFYSYTKVYVAGVQRWAGSETTEGYVYMSSPTTTYTVTAKFYNTDADGSPVSCSVRP